MRTTEMRTPIFTDQSHLKEGNKSRLEEMNPFMNLEYFICQDMLH